MKILIEVTIEILTKVQFDYAKLVNTAFRIFQMTNAALA